MSAPSGYTALDFVGFTDKGTYSPIVKYMRNDLVHYGGNIMRCKVDDTMNVTPVEGANWEIWVGASANLVERVIAPLENNPADVAFGVGRQIIYDDWLWEVIAPIAVGDALIDYAVDPTNANIKKSDPVETQLLAVKAEADATDNMIAPTEANASSSSAPYSVGDQLILNNILYDVIAAIQIGDALTTGTGGNIKAADTLTEQLNAKANSSEVASELATIDSSIQTLEDNDDAILNKLGAKNLLRNNAVSQTISGITFTVNTDTTSPEYGAVNVSGTATDLIVFVLNNVNALKYNVPTILSGCPSGGSINKYELTYYDDSTGSSIAYRDFGNGVEIPANSNSFRVAIIIRSGVTVSDLIFYPMLRFASVADDTYVPYAMTNALLTATSNQLSSRIGLQKITFDDEAGSVPISNVEFMIQRLPNTPYIRLVIYMHDQQNTRYICKFDSVEVVTG